MSEEKERHPGGRPTTYKQEYCDLVKNLGDEGATVYEMADKCDVCTETLYEWARTHEEFSVAFTRARDKSKAYAMKFLKENMHDKWFKEKAADMWLKYGLRFSDQRKLRLSKYAKEKDRSKKAKMIDEYFSKGEITLDEATKMSDINRKGIEADKLVSIEDRLAILEGKK